MTREVLPVEEAITALLLEIPPDTDSKQLPSQLDGVLKLLAQMDKPLAEAYLRSDIKARFKLVNSEVDAYRRVYERCRTEHLSSDALEKGSLGADNMGYQRKAGGLVQLRAQNPGCGYVLLTNFDAAIVSEVIRDDGVESQRLFEVEAGLDGKTQRFMVPANRFGTMQWVPENLGAEAVVYVGAKDHARAAIQILSERVPKRWVFTHTGWRDIDGHWVYLHAGGAIGPIGPDSQIEVRLEGSLTRYQLKETEGASSAVRASLQFLDLGPDSIVFPIYAAIWRALLGDPDFSVHLAGPTGTGKTELAALAQQHYGASMDSRHLPANWSSTGNALEALAFAAKDALLVIDDFVPTGTGADVYHLNQKADRVLRAQGNITGRQRMRDDTTLRPEKPPRGLILSTGEDLPRGHSLRSRLFAVSLGPEDLEWEKVSDCQRNAQAGLFSQALAEYVFWLSLRYENVQKDLPPEIQELRQEAFLQGMHRRTATIVANLALGFRYFLGFLDDIGILDPNQREVLWQRCLKALHETASAQSQFQLASEPVERFLELLRAALTSGRAHIADQHGESPLAPRPWGWRQYTIGKEGETEWRPQGDRIGWVYGEDLYLEPEAAHSVAGRLARDSNETLPVSSKTLHKRLDERGLLLTKDREDRLLVRKALGGARRSVLHLHADSLLLLEEPDQSDRTDKAETDNSTAFGSQKEEPVPEELHKRISARYVRRSDRPTG